MRQPTLSGAALGYISSQHPGGTLARGKRWCVVGPQSDENILALESSPFALQLSLLTKEFALRGSGNTHRLRASACLKVSRSDDKRATRVCVLTTFNLVKISGF